MSILHINPPHMTSPSTHPTFKIQQKKLFSFQNYFLKSKNFSHKNKFTIYDPKKDFRSESQFIIQFWKKFPREKLISSWLNLIKTRVLMTHKKGGKYISNQICLFIELNLWNFILFPTWNLSNPQTSLSIINTFYPTAT